MSYRVELRIPSCCADKLDVLAEAEQCPVEEILLRVMMAGMSAYSALHRMRLEDGKQAVCESSASHLEQMMQEVWG